MNASGEHEIFYKDNPDRTISINDCLKKCLPNDKDPVRLNLERIIELRNTSTHFIIPEYEHIYGSVFQACLNNYQEKLLQYHGKEITNYCNYQFLTLVVPAVLDEDGIKAKGFRKRLRNGELFLRCVLPRFPNRGENLATHPVLKLLSAGKF